MTVDSACSSGLLAVHMACRNLHDGESDLALAGGASVILDPRKFRQGRPRACSHRPDGATPSTPAADGFVASEGCAVVLLKRLADAQRDGDRILAVIRGSAANQDGRTVNIATPSQPLKQWVYRNALAAAGVDPEPSAWSKRTDLAHRWRSHRIPSLATFTARRPVRAGVGEDKLRTWQRLPGR